MSAPESAKPVAWQVRFCADGKCGAWRTVSRKEFDKYKEWQDGNAEVRALGVLADRAAQRQPETRDERAAFEAWFQELSAFKHRSENAAKSIFAEGYAWKAWQARAALASPQDRSA